MSYDAHESSRQAGEPVHLYLFTNAASTAGPYAFTSAESAITRDGITYQPWTISHGDIEVSGSPDRKDLEINLARGSDLDALFNTSVPSYPVVGRIYRGHLADTPTVANYPLIWSGQLSGADYSGSSELNLTGMPASAALQRPGLRRNWQLSCPHVLYGAQCQANKTLVQNARTVDSVLTSPSRIVLTAALTSLVGVSGFNGGHAQWTRPGGLVETVSIVSVSADGLTVTIRGPLRELAAGNSVTFYPGCDKTRSRCTSLFNNILNYGGQPFIPLENPLSNVSIFY